MPEDQFSAANYIKAAAEQTDSEIDAGKLALAMVYDDHSGLNFPSLQKYIHHLKIIKEQVMQHYHMLLDAGSDDDVGVRMAALKSVIVEEFGYEADDPQYEILESADIIRVIDRGRGCAASLGILYLDAARKCGWQIAGVEIASQFLCRIEHGGKRQIFDPALGCRPMHAHDLRALVKGRLGKEAELSFEYIDGMDVRSSLVHLCNLLKTRRIEMGEYEKALDIIERMRVLKPSEYRLLFDAGVLYARTGQIDKAKACLGAYIEKTPNPYDRYEAKALLGDLE